MLVLSRKQGQSIEFAEMDVLVRVLSIKGSRVQLGIEAPEEITIERTEKRLAVGATGTAGDPPLSQTQQVGEELRRVEAELATLAELADSAEMSLARQIAAESIRRLQGIRRALHLAACEAPTVARPIAEFVRVRTEVLDRLRQRQDSRQNPAIWSADGQDEHSAIVRQSPAEYAVDSHTRRLRCTVA
jgi:carbon storage regulator